MQLCKFLASNKVKATNMLYYIYFVTIVSTKLVGHEVRTMACKSPRVIHSNMVDIQVRTG